MEERKTNLGVSLYSKIFALMFLGLGLTALISFYCYNTGMTENLLIDGGFNLLLIIEVIVVIVFRLLLYKVSPMVATGLFFIYAAINGVTLSIIYYMYEMTSILTILLISALLFGGFAIVGYATKRDLTKLGSICMGVLIAGIIASLINLFMQNTMLDIALSWIILIVFFGITAYDMQKIKRYEEQGIIGDKLYIYGALELYLDFINIFIRILSLFGKRK